VKSSPTEVTIQDWTVSDADALPCCGIKSLEHPGRCQKDCWLEAHVKKGLRAKFALDTENQPCGYIEYLPGEYAWRGVRASGYMFVHCLWTFSKRAQNKGVASALLRACFEDAKQNGMRGVAALAREGPWLASPAVFVKNGFQLAAKAEPDYQLLVRKLDPAAPDPSFAGNWEKKLKKYKSGLTIIRSQQCPHIAKFADAIAAASAKEYRLKPNIVELKSHRDAQNAPTPYAVFAIIYDGRLVADHQISLTRFRNIMRTLDR
jgi:GNAT superfamily N-acetyltransferase